MKNIENPWVLADIREARSNANFCRVLNDNESKICSKAAGELSYYFLNCNIEEVEKQKDELNTKGVDVELDVDEYTICGKIYADVNYDINNENNEVERIYFSNIKFQVISDFEIIDELEIEDFDDTI